MSPERGRSFATLTHARLRAEQGDVAGAARILRVILEVQPGHDGARGMLADLKLRGVAPHSEPAEEAAEAVTPATAPGLTRRFRDVLGPKRRSMAVDRLQNWLERAQRARGRRRVR